MKYIMFGAGDDGCRFLQLVGEDRISYVVDNNTKLHGSRLGGKKIYPPIKLASEVEDFTIIISVSLPYQKEIEAQLDEMSIKEYCSATSYLKTIQLNSDARLRNLKNKYKGKRCFIVGTGPSLSVGDLERLEERHEVCFASNKIFKIFSRTAWRPDFYCITDMDVFAFYYDYICNMDIEYKFLVSMRGTRYEHLDYSKMESGFNYPVKIFKSYDEYDGEIVPGFSENIDQYIVDGGITVTYAMIQIANYLGFTEIYLIGVDFNYSDESGLDVNRTDHFCEDYNSPGEKINKPMLTEILLAYKNAARYSQKHALKIYNATRGGALEVFPRKNMDEILNM